MTITYGAWIDCGDDVTALSVTGQLPKTINFHGDDYPMQVLTVHLDGSTFLHVLPRVGRPDQLGQSSLRELMNTLALALRVAHGYRFALVGEEVDGAVGYQELLSQPEEVGRYPGLIVDEKIRSAAGRHATAFVPLAPGYYWRPYVDEVVQVR